MSDLKKKRKQNYRTRTYATIVYEESASSNWQDILGMEFVPAFISPLHCKDKDPEDPSKLKKAHYHVILMFKTVKSIEQAQKVFDKIKGVGCVQVGDLRTYARYLCHLDHPEKFPYDPTEVRALCGANYFDVINCVVDKMQVTRSMQKYCEDNKVTNFAVFCKYCAEYNAEWYQTLWEKPFFIKEFIKAQWFLLHNDGRYD